MKGIVFTEFIDMVEQKFSPDMANRVIEDSDLPSGGIYTSVGTYPHTEMVSMVSKLSEYSGIAVPDLISTFGSHLFGVFLKGYPGFFEGVSSAFEFLPRIENMIHVEVRKLYPDAELPRFDYQTPDADTMIMTYHSKRHFGDLAAGLLQACIEHYGEPIELSRITLDEPDLPVQFTLKRRNG